MKHRIKIISLVCLSVTVSYLLIAKGDVIELSKKKAVKNQKKIDIKITAAVIDSSKKSFSNIKRSPSSVMRRFDRQKKDNIERYTKTYAKYQDRAILANKPLGRRSGRPFSVVKNFFAVKASEFQDGFGTKVKKQNNHIVFIPNKEFILNKKDLYNTLPVVSYKNSSRIGILSGNINIQFHKNSLYQKEIISEHKLGVLYSNATISYFRTEPQSNDDINEILKSLKSVQEVKLAELEVYGETPVPN